jgi:short-subunit dehydrogenase
VTGASAGIGREFVRQLAASGLNLVLASRNQNRLESLAEELTHRYGVAIRTVPVDLGNAGSTEGLEEATADLEIGLLVNNAGVETHGAFLKSDLDRENALLQLNIVRPMELAHVFGQKMARRGKGGILFVSSTLAYQPVPYFANYSSSKAYILALGEALHFELNKSGVDVTVLSTGLTDTAMAGNIGGFDFGKTPMPMMDVEPVVRTALKHLGRRSFPVP